MFASIDLELDSNGNVEDIYTNCLNTLCSDSMTILQNNSKVLRYLTDKSLKQELRMLVTSLNMAIKHARFELVQHILFELKNDVHKLAALEIMYYDECTTLLRTDIYNTFMSENMKKHAFVSPTLKEVFDVLDKTFELSPTNAAFALKTAIDLNEHGLLNKIYFASGRNEEFNRQIGKRFHANFDISLDEALFQWSLKSQTSKIEVSKFQQMLCG